MKFNYGKIFLLGFGFFGVSIIWATYNAFVPLFLANKFALNAAVVGFFMTLDNIAALFIQPTVGAFSDRMRTRIGRRMPFLLIGAPIAAAAFGLIPLAGVLPLFVACTVTTILSMALWRTPVVALMPDVTPSRYRSQANGIINFMGGIGSIIAYLIGSKLYNLDPAYPFWLGSVLVLVAVALVFIFVKEPKEYEVKAEKQPSIWESLRSIWSEQDKSPLLILLAIFSWFVAYNAVEAFFTLYVNRHLGQPEAEGTRLLGQLSVAFVLFALPSGYIAGRLGRKPVIITGLLIMTACILSMFFLDSQTLLTPLTKLPVLGVVPVLGLLLIIAGIGWACININSLPMVVDTTTDDRIGTYTGLYYLFSTLAAIAGPNINGQLIHLMGEDYNMITMAAPIFFVLALVFMLFVRRGEAKTGTAG
ncbi:MAG TPA: SLC45 family MFS transporter [Anaerolineales bacterium]|nr:SLC45 family MFS transporter [Anaerolineales bacterium]